MFNSFNGNKINVAKICTPRVAKPANNAIRNHLNGFNNEIKPKNGINAKNVNACTNNGRANCQNKSWIHFNGVLKRLNKAIKFNSNGSRNNASINKLWNGSNPGKPSRNKIPKSRITPRPLKNWFNNPNN